MLYFYITLYWHCTHHLHQPEARSRGSVPGASGARCQRCPVWVLSGGARARGCAGVCGHRPEPVLSPAHTQRPSGDGACCNRRVWVGTSHLEVPSFSLPRDSLAAAVAGASHGVPTSAGPQGTGDTPSF